ncbi:MAG: cell division protein FtsQ/DivIB [Pseudolabrys sp.]|nr:cell division protein FtsQ/DivIB [Pseudolabrys sp.]MDP2295106.1 cell division protein FtsQ/DivIB [Pseudolabrys sp.]
MDRRGTLDQSSDHSTRPASAALRSHSLARLGWPRTLRRFFTTLIELDIPRGLGSSSVALLLLASVCYGVVKGEHGPDIVANLHSLCDDAANAAGFGIAEVALTGEHEVSRDEILKTAGITEHTSLLFLDAAQTRARLLTNPWISEATVLKLYPGRLRIEIKERKAFALWQKDARVSLIASDGTVLSPSIAPRFADLPRVIGAGAEMMSPDLLALVARYPGIARQVDASVLVAERRWNLHLKNGVEVMLPESEPERALRTLANLDREKKLLSRDIVLVDLRLTDRVTVRQSDAAYAVREEALKAAAKAAKKKGTQA